MRLDCSNKPPSLTPSVGVGAFWFLLFKLGQSKPMPLKSLNNISTYL
jgi:hypothetical protein